VVQGDAAVLPIPETPRSACSGISNDATPAPQMTEEKSMVGKRQDRRVALHHSHARILGVVPQVSLHTMDRIPGS